jgi:CHAD domain-containing protein
MSPDTIFSQYRVDVAHTRHVAGLSLALFDSVRRAYDLPRKARGLIELGAWLHDVGVSTDVAQHHIVGRDIVLSTDLSDLDEDQRAIVACLVAFHRKKVRPEQEPSFLRLGKKQRQIALQLASLLRVADGLDYSHTQTTHIQACDVSDGAVRLSVAGPHAEGDGSRAVKKADLWRKVLGSAVEVTPTAPSEAEAALADLAMPALDIRPLVGEDSLSEEVRRLMRRYFQKMLEQECGVRADKDIEFVHDMRVATRRLRALFPLVEEVAPVKQVQACRRGTRKIARVLGSVRDGDVFLKQITTAMQEMPEAQREGMQPLTDALRRDRAAAFKGLIGVLDSAEYAAFKRDFAAFMTDDAAQWDSRLRLRDMVGSTLLQRYEQLRAYETQIDMANLADNDDTVLHEARIAGKRLRYLFDLFGDRFGKYLQPVLESLVALQENLGALQDIAVAKAYVAQVPANEAQQQALDAYVASRDAERLQLLQEFPQVWQQIVGATYRRRLMELIIHV